MRNSRYLTTILLGTALSAAHAQAPKTTVEFRPDQGIVVKHDTVFKTTIRFRMQNRAAFFSAAGDDLSLGSAEWRTRRARLRFDGYVLSPRLQYKLQLGFTEADMDIQDGSEDQYPLRDAVVIYALSRQWNIGFGQAKLPGNRERVVSSNQLELPERSIVNGAFTLDRDFGLFLNWQRDLGSQVVRLRTAISSGEGRLSAPGGGGLCYTARGEWLPFGSFTNEGDYFEGDELREVKPKLSIAAGYSSNDHTRRANGQLGELFAPGAERTVNTFIADMMFKYRGWSLLTEVADRRAEGSPLSVDTLAGRTLFVNEGRGLNTQLGYMVGKHGELALRYSIVSPGERVESVMRRNEEAWLGYTRYLNGHRIKLQSALIYSWRNGIMDFDHTGNRWGLMLQMEVGI
ncbi:MAG TPA: porin [Flavobacteriales bacterium]